jgi:hypothetical protein
MSVSITISKVNETEFEHIHGDLTISWNGKVVPGLGYFGPDDVCMGTWIHEFHEIIEALSKSETACYVFDEGEQGQPAYKFKRDGQWVYLSIIASELSDGLADPDFCDLKSDYAQFFDEILSFLNRFDVLMRESKGAKYDWWLRDSFPNGILIK